MQLNARSDKVKFVLACFIIVMYCIGCFRSDGSGGKVLKRVAGLKRKLVYVERKPEPDGSTITSGAYNMIVYDLDRNEKIYLDKRFVPEYRPILSPNGSLIAYFPTGFPHSDAFVIWDISSDSESKLQNKLNAYELGGFGVRAVEFLSDSQLVFSVEERLYVKSINGGTLSLLCSLGKGKIINEIAVFPLKKLIAIAWNTSGDELTEKSLAYYDGILDSITATDITLSRLYNWAPDGHRLGYVDTSMVVWDYVSNRTERIGSIHTDIFDAKGGFFLSNESIFCIGGKGNTGPSSRNYYVYNLSTRRIGKTITTEGYSKGFVGAHYEEM